MPDLVPVRVRDCACPDTPHADTGDVVYLWPKVPLELGIACTQALAEFSPDTGRVTRAFMVAYVRFGVAATNWQTPPDIEGLIADYELSGPVAEAANDLYAETILRPLGMSLPKPSHGGRTAGSTSRTRRSRTPSPA